VELNDAKQLQRISTLLIQEGNKKLYRQILDDAIALTRADAGSIQMVEAERGALRLLVSQGSYPESATFWEWVEVDSGSSCGTSLRIGERVVVPNTERCDFIADTPDLKAYRRSDIRAVQSTPLISRSGGLLGMLSTHWRQLHQPPERELRLLDLLARQAADLIERAQSEVALHQVNTSLERRVGERTAELEQAHDQLRDEMSERQRMQEALFQREKLAALGLLLANVAHELNNPLSVATMELDNLAEVWSADVETESLDTLRQAIERCNSVVQSFLSLARQQSTTHSPVALSALIDEVIVLLRHALEADGIALELNLAEELPCFKRMPISCITSSPISSPMPIMPCSRAIRPGS
jgi:C4-dicarboxylate-specific signal transduction histidine kinase